MLKFVVVYFLAKAARIVLQPVVIIPVLGVATSRGSVYWTYERWSLIAILVAAGVAVQVVDWAFEKYRADLLQARLSVYYESFPKESRASDIGWLAVSYFPNFVTLVGVLYLGFWFLDMPNGISHGLILASAILGVSAVMLGRFVSVPSFNIHGTPPPKEKQFDIHRAAEQGDLEQLETLIGGGADLDRQTNKQMGPIHLAIKAGQRAAAIRLMEAGADVNRLGDHFKPKTPLMFAAEKGDPELVKLLLDHGAKDGVCNREGHNVLYYAKEDPELFAFFLSRGVDCAKVDGVGESLLSIAAGMEADFGPHPAAKTIVEMLLEQGLSPNGLDGERSRPLIQAVYARNLEVVEFLLKANADPNTPDAWGGTALLAAVESVEPAIAGRLIEKGADVEQKGNVLWDPKQVYPRELIDKKFETYLSEETEGRLRQISKFLG